MPTPTDPYSRPDHEDGHDDILDPLPEEQDDRIVPEADRHEELMGSDAEPMSAPPVADEPLDAPVAEPVVEPADATIVDEPGDSHPPIDSETESTQAWTPDFSSREPGDDTASSEPVEDPVSKQTERERWEAAFGSAGTADDSTLQASSADETRVSDPVPAPPMTAAGGAAYPTRTSVFNRGSADTAGGPYVSTPPEATQHAVPAQPQFDHRYEEPIPEEPRGRGWAHAGVFFATLILAPLAWYLVADAGVRLADLEGSAWNTGTVDWLVVLELLGALLCLGVLWFLASFSSVGAIVFGAILAIAGAVAVFAPAFAQDLLQSSAMQQFANLNDFTGNVGHHLTNDLATGRMAVYGFLLLMTGVVSHNARRQGADRGNILARRDVLLSRKSDS